MMEFSLKEIVAGIGGIGLLFIGYLMTLIWNHHKNLKVELASAEKRLNEKLSDKHSEHGLKIKEISEQVSTLGSVIAQNKEIAAKTITEEREILRRELEKRDLAIHTLASELRKDIGEALQLVKGSTDVTRERIDSLYSALLQLRGSAA